MFELRRFHTLALVAFLALAGLYSERASAMERPRPGQALSVPVFKLADAGAFDPDGAFAVWTADTERGYEGAYVQIPTKDGVLHALYSMPTGRVIFPFDFVQFEALRAAKFAAASKPGTAPRPPEDLAVPKPVAPSEGSESAKGAPPACVSGHRALKTFSGSNFYPDGPLDKGVVYVAKSVPEGVKLLVHALKESQPREYGPITGLNGVKLEQALALSTSVNGDVLIVGTAQGALYIAEIEDVFLDELMNLRLKVIQEAFPEQMKNPLKAKSWSLSAIAPQLDRTFDALAVLSDGKAYLGTMPHHPTNGSHILCYDPARDELKDFGPIEKLSKETDPEDVPGMMHAPPVEANGVAYFVCQDPFYGRSWKFPELPPGAQFPGSHILGYDMQQGTWNDRGIATPIEGGLFGGRSVFWLAADAKREILYARMGYHGGPMYRLDLKTGAFEENIFQCDSKDMFVAASGKVYFGKTVETKPADPNDPKSKPETAMFMHAYDPETREVRAVPKAKYISPFKGQDGRKVVYVVCGAASIQAKSEGLTVSSFDTSTETFKKEGAFASPTGGGDTAYRNGVAYKLSMKGVSQGTNRVVHLITLNLATQETKDHGMIVDQDGRVAQELDALDVGEDGTVYAAGAFWAKAGDAYSTRLKRHFMNDDRFIVIKGVKP